MHSHSVVYISVSFKYFHHQRNKRRQGKKIYREVVDICIHLAPYNSFHIHLYNYYSPPISTQKGKEKQEGKTILFERYKYLTGLIV